MYGMWLAVPYIKCRGVVVTVHKLNSENDNNTNKATVDSTAHCAVF